MKGKSYINQWFKYLKNKISDRERHEFEKNLLNDPFLSDAVDGFAHLSEHELKADLIQLEQNLNSKIRGRKRNLFLVYLPYAAALVILLAVGTLIIKNKSFHQMSHQYSESVEEAEIKTNDEILAAEQARSIPDSNENQPLQSEKQLALQIEKDDATNISRKRASNQETEQNKLNTSQIEAPIVLTEENAEMAVVDEVAMQEITEPEISKPAASMMAEPTSQPEVVAKKEINITAKGKIIDVATQEPIAGAVIVTNNDKGTVSDTDGNFSMNLINDSTLKISYIGYETKTVTAQELMDSSKPIELEASQLALEEVVVVNSNNKKANREQMGAVAQSSKSKSETTQPIQAIDEESKKPWAVIVYSDSVTLHAMPAGGEKQFSKYIRSQSKLQSKDPQKVILEIIVGDLGLLSEIHILESLSESYSQEAIRLLKEGPEWTSAQKKGTPVEERLQIIITFQSH